MNSPVMRDTMSQVMSNPEMMQQMISMNPLLANNPQVSLLHVHTVIVYKRITAALLLARSINLR